MNPNPYEPPSPCESPAGTIASEKDWMRVKTDVRILESCTSQGELTVSVFSCVLGALMAIGFYQLGYTEAAWGAALASVPSGICCVGAKVKLLLIK